MSSQSTAVPAAEVLADDVRQELLTQLQSNSLMIGSFELSSGAISPYLVDVKKTSMTPSGFRALKHAIRPFVREFGATAVGGRTMGADAIAYAAVAGGEDVRGFSVRKEPKPHGLGLLIEGPILESDRCLIVDDVVTTGTSTIEAITAVKALGIEICGVVCVVDRLVGGAAERIEAAAHAPYRALTTIDEVYPERPDR